MTSGDVKRLNRNAKRLVKLSVSIFLISYLFAYHVDINSFLSSLYNLDISFYLLAYCLSVLGIAFSILRWDIILKHGNQHIPKVRLLELYFVGIFYNMLLPSSLGGDVVKAYKLTRQDGDTIRQFMSVPIDRVVGLITLLLTMVFSVIFLRDFINDFLLAQLLFATSIGTGGLVLATSDWFRIFLRRIETASLINRLNVQSKMTRIADSLEELRDPEFLLQTISFSACYLLLSFMVVYLIGRSLGVEIPVGFIVAVVPVIRLINQLPISIGGIGVREGLYAYFFPFVGVRVEVAITIGVLELALHLMNATIGGIVDIKGNLTAG